MSTFWVFVGQFREAEDTKFLYVSLQVALGEQASSIFRSVTFVQGAELVVNNANYGPEAVACEDEEACSRVF